MLLPAQQKAFAVSRNFMNIQTALSEYRQEANFFAPEYERENEVLYKFHFLHGTLHSEEINELKNILENAPDWQDRYFVADLLYLYKPIPDSLLEPMLMCAITHKDPSFNRIFLTPCVRSFGLERVKQLLKIKKRSGSISEKLGVLRLNYWLGRIRIDSQTE